ncbi:hypothetical protein EJB05_48124, partial [Eragrostis curvula]
MVNSCFTQYKLNYSEKNLAVGEFLHSENISAGGHLWRIRCYPHGFQKEDKGEYISLYLQLMSDSKNVKAIFEAFLMDKNGVPSLSHAIRTLRVCDSKTPWGMSHQFVKRADLKPLYVVDGWITIMWGVIVLRDDQLAVPPSDIGSHFGNLLDSTDGSEVSFVVGGETFPAHRAVLAARSPVFKAQLFGSMADAKMPTITLHDIAAATFKIMLRFMYTDALPGKDELGDSPIEAFEDLLAVADRYALDRLKLFCASKLWENVTVDTVAAALSCAETYNCPELKKNCMAFVTEEKNVKKVLLTDGYIQLAQKFPSVLAELREKLGA